MTNHPSFGSFKCFLGAGDYDFSMAKSGYTFETLTGVQGHGTMAQQDASNVVITGGSATMQVIHAGTLEAGEVGINAIPSGSSHLLIKYDKQLHHGIALQHLVVETGGFGNPLTFMRLDGNIIGSISTTVNSTAYNTSSDVRLKHAIAPLTGALDVVRALRPVTFRWRADDSEGRSFLAHEVQQIAPEAVTGEPDAVDEAGGIVPQGLDLSKLVPYLVGACQELAQQVQALTARLEAAGV